MVIDNGKYQNSPQVKKVILLIFDAFRYDYAKYDESQDAKFLSNKTKNHTKKKNYVNNFMAFKNLMAK